MLIFYIVLGINNICSTRTYTLYSGKDFRPLTNPFALSYPILRVPIIYILMVLTHWLESKEIKSSRAIVVRTRINNPVRCFLKPFLCKATRSLSPLYIYNSLQRTHCGNPKSLFDNINSTQYLPSIFAYRIQTTDWYLNICTRSLYIYTKFSHPAVIFWYSNQSINRRTMRPRRVVRPRHVPHSHRTYIILSFVLFILL